MSLMKTISYLKALALFAGIYIPGVAVLGVIALQFGIEHSSLRMTLMFVAACGAAMVFMKEVRHPPNTKEGLILTFGSLSIILIIGSALRLIAEIPFFLGLFFAQSFSALLMVYIVYGFVAKKYLFKSITLPPGVSRSELTDLAKQADKAWVELYGPPQSPRSQISLDDYLESYGPLPMPDRSHIKRNHLFSEGDIDLGWSSCTADHGNYKRPFYIEIWASAGHVTMISFFFSRIGIEDMTKEDALGMLTGAGLIECVANTPIELLRTEDRQGHPIWSINLTVGADNTIYITKSPPYQSYADDINPSGLHAYNHCIVCGADDITALFAFDGRGIPHDHRGHDFIYDSREICVCSTCGNGQLEVYSHDCWPANLIWDKYWWYAISEDGLSALRNLQDAPCKTPLKPECECGWHKQIAQVFEQLSSDISSVQRGFQTKHYLWLSFELKKEELVAKPDGERGVEDVVSGG